MVNSPYILVATEIYWPLLIGQRVRNFGQDDPGFPGKMMFSPDVLLISHWFISFGGCYMLLYYTISLVTRWYYNVLCISSNVNPFFLYTLCAKIVTWSAPKNGGFQSWRDWRAGDQQHLHPRWCQSQGARYLETRPLPLSPGGSFSEHGDLAGNFHGKRPLSYRQKLC